MPNQAHRVTTRSLIFVAVGLIGLAVAAIGATAWSLRNDALRDAIHDTGNIATVLAEQTARSVQSIDLVLTETRERLGSFDTTTATGIYNLMRSLLAHQLLQERLSRLPQADVIFVLDADGNVLTSSRRWPSLEGNFADRDYFAQFKPGVDGEAGDQIYVSAPVTNRFTGAHTVFFSKPWRSTRGEFLGVIVAGLKFDGCQHIYQSLTAIRGQSFVFLRRDGTVLVRHPETVDRGEELMPIDSPWHDLVRAGGGSYRSLEYIDHAARLGAVRPL